MNKEDTLTDILTYDIAPGRVEAFSTTVGKEPPCHVISPHQVHGVQVAVVDDPTLTREDLEGYDALITSLKGCAIGVRTADCIPVLLYDPVREAVAAIHSGWRGTSNRISQKTIVKMTETFGTDPEDILAVIGPGICRGCFQVGEEVVGYFKDNGIDIEPIYSWDGPRTDDGSMRGGHHLDLPEQNRLLLIESGVKAENIRLSGICTYEDRNFYSARRDGIGCGRIINAIRLLRKSAALPFQQAP